MIVTVQARDYLDHGIEPIPLYANGKSPIGDGWQHRPLSDLWCDAPLNANIGVRHGNGTINIDCDQSKGPETFSNVKRGLDGLGVTEPPIVQTASVIGRGVYLRCNDIGDGVAFRKLSADIGAGELRFGVGSLSVLPDSQVNGNTYKLISGSWQALPVVQWRDLLWLLPLQRVITADESISIRLRYHAESSRINDLFDKIGQTAKGQAVGKYPSRSEAEAAIVAGYILNGWTFEQINDEFRRRGIGHFAEADRYAERYLYTTYVNALAEILSSPIREALTGEYQRAAVAAWPGRTGASDQFAYLSVIAECWAAGAFEASVSVREVAEYSAVGTITASRALKRLAQGDYIRLISSASDDGAFARVYRLSGENGTRVTEIRVPLSTPPPVPYSTPPELAARDALGKSALIVYQHLDSFSARSIKQLARVTGRARSTVKRALDRLSRYQLAIVTDGGAWVTGPNDLETVARDFDCEARAAQRRNRHTTEREWYRKAAKRNA